MAVRQYPTEKELREEAEDFFEAVSRSVHMLFEVALISSDLKLGILEKNDENLGILEKNKEDLLTFYEGTYFNLERCRQYAIYGTGFDLADAPAVLQMLERIDEFQCWFGGSLAKSKWQKLSMIYDMINARIALDGDGDLIATEEYPEVGFIQRETLTVKQVALLAFVEERSVRNAISKGELESETDGSATVIRNHVARKWLEGRRGYNPTQRNAKGMEDLRSLDNAQAIAEYLLLRRKALELDNIESFLKQAADTVITADQIKDLEAGNFHMPLSSCRDLATLYKESEKLFTQKIMQIYFPDQYQMIIN